MIGSKGKAVAVIGSVVAGRLDRGRRPSVIAVPFPLRVLHAGLLVAALVAGACASQPGGSAVPSPAASGTAVVETPSAAVTASPSLASTSTPSALPSVPSELVGRWRGSVGGGAVVLTIQEDGYALGGGFGPARGSFEVEGDVITFSTATSVTGWAPIAGRSTETLSASRRSAPTSAQGAPISWPIKRTCEWTDAVAGVASATIPSNNVIHACLAKSGGALLANVTYVPSPGDNAVFHVFVAGIDTVRLAGERAAISFERVVESVAVEAEPEPGLAGFRGSPAEEVRRD